VLVVADPNNWQAWYNLARVQAAQGDAKQSSAALAKAFALNPSDRVVNNSPVTFHDFVQKDPFFDRIRATPEFQQAVATNAPGK
jgi:tetratricopeptide (TPR) repeat protein